MKELDKLTVIGEDLIPEECEIVDRKARELAESVERRANSSADAVADKLIKSEGTLASRTISAGGFNPATGYKYGTSTPERYNLAKTSIYAYPQSRTYLCSEEYLLQALDYGRSAGEGSLNTEGNAQKPYYTGRHTGWSRMVSVPAWTYIGINIKRADGADIVAGAAEAGFTTDELNAKVTDELYNKFFRLTDTTADGTFRVCAFNVGCFDYGVRSGHSPYGYGDDNMLDEFLRTFDQCRANVYLFSEWDNYFNQEKGELSSDKLGALKPHWSTLDINAELKKETYAYQKIASDYELKDEYYGSYGTNRESRHWVDCVVHVKGKDVHLISTHMSLKADYRREATDKLQKYIADHELEYVIVGGDFNLGINETDQPQSIEGYYNLINEDIKQWTDFGYLSVQGSKFGNPTYNNLVRTMSGHETYKPYKGYDNFFYTPNLDITEVFTVNFGASDHYALCADFKIADDKQASNRVDAATGITGKTTEDKYYPTVNAVIDYVDTVIGDLKNELLTILQN